MQPSSSRTRRESACAIEIPIEVVQATTSSIPQTFNIISMAPAPP